MEHREDNPWSRPRGRWPALLVLLVALGTFPRPAAASGAPTNRGIGLLTAMLLVGGGVAIALATNRRTRAPDLHWPDHRRRRAGQAPAAAPGPVGEAQPAPAQPEAEPTVPQPAQQPSPSPALAPELPAPLPEPPAGAEQTPELDWSLEPPPPSAAHGSDDPPLSWSLRPSRRGLVAYLSGSF